MLREKKYILKIYDTPLMEISVKIDDFGRFKAKAEETDNRKRELFPLLLLEPTDDNVQSWLQGRTIPKNRRFVDKILETAGLTFRDKIGILDICKGLSVNDAYWLDDGSTDVSFDDVNPVSYTHLDVYKRQSDKISEEREMTDKRLKKLKFE